MLNILSSVYLLKLFPLTFYNGDTRNLKTTLCCSHSTSVKTTLVIKTNLGRPPGTKGAEVKGSGLGRADGQSLRLRKVIRFVFNTPFKNKPL